MSLKASAVTPGPEFSDNPLLTAVQLAPLLVERKTPPCDGPVPPGAVAGEMVQLAIRPENLRLVPASSADGSNPVPGEVAEVTVLGNLVD